MNKSVESEQVVIGQRYRDLSAILQKSEWIVERMFSKADGFEHVVLRSVSDPTRQKTLTRLAIADTTRFVPVGATLAVRSPDQSA